MPIIAALVGGGLGLLGSASSGRSARKAAETKAQAERDAAQMATEESRFRPIGITTGFGRSNFQMGEDGRLQSAGYELNPELQAMRDQLMQQAGSQGMGLAQQGLGAAQGMFGLGQQYLAQSPEQAAQQWMQTQQAALAPGREQAMGGLMNRLAQTGTQGLGVAQAGGGQANPLMQAFANAQAQQDLQLAGQAQEQGRAQTQFGTGLFADALRLAGGSYDPMAAQLRQAQGIEGMGQQALDMGAQLGGRMANSAGADALFRGGMGAAQTIGDVQRYSPAGGFLTGLSQNQDFTSQLGAMFQRQPAVMPPSPVSGQASYAPGSANANFASWFQ